MLSRAEKELLYGIEGYSETDDSTNSPTGSLISYDEVFHELLPTYAYKCTTWNPTLRSLLFDNAFKKPPTH